MELFPAQPDLSLQISPPNSKPSSSWRSSAARDEDESSLDLGFWKRALDSRSSSTISSSMAINSINPTKGVYSSSSSWQYPNQFHRLVHGGINLSQQELNYLMTSNSNSIRPIRGIPVYQIQNPPSTTTTTTEPQYLDAAAAVSLPLTCNNYNHYSETLMRSRFVSSRFPGKRSMRAPRMRWTTTLHARFVHAVELLGGHERATPKSVLELMDVKDLTLAHVKSHLQMYRTVKSTDRAAATSGHSDAFENGSSGDTSDDFLFDIQNSQKSDGRQINIQNSQKSDGRQINIQNQDKDLYGPWSNSSREAWLHGRPSDLGGGNIISLENEMEPKSLSYDRVSEVSSSSETCPKKPNLDFTLGRPQ